MSTRASVVVDRLKKDDTEGVRAKLTDAERKEMASISSEVRSDLLIIIIWLKSADSSTLTDEQRDILGDDARKKLEQAEKLIKRADELKTLTDTRPKPLSEADQARVDLAVADALCVDLAACEKACPTTNPYACVVLSGFYAEGRGGAKKDLAKSTAIVRKGCAAKHKYSCLYVGTLESKAAECDTESFCTEACARDLYEGCTRLGVMYVEGDGVTKDPARALPFLKKGCDGGSGGGCNTVGMLYAKGMGVTKNMTTAQTYFQKGCDVSFDSACGNLIGVKCINAAKTSKQRRPGDDAKCAKAVASGRLGIDRKKTYSAYETPDSSSLDICYTAMRGEECFQMNVLARGTTIYCCP